MLANFVQETANAPGSATVINLAGPPTGRRGFLAAFASGASVYYFMDDGTQSEWGIGTVTSGTPNTLSRTTVISNSAGTTARLPFTGTTRVYNEIPAEMMLDAPWVDVASAATVNLGAAISANLRITGTTAITSFGTAASGTRRQLRFAGALTLTHNATSLILPGGSNVTTAAGDTAVAVSLGGGNWVVVEYEVASGDITARAGSLRSQLSGAPTTGQVLLGNGSARLFYNGTRFDLNGPLDVNGVAVAPLPQAGAGVGQFISLNANAANVTLPSGGTWAYWVMGFNSSVFMEGLVVAGVVAGGTVVAPTAGTFSFVRGFAWRIA